VELVESKNPKLLQAHELKQRVKEFDRLVDQYRKDHRCTQPRDLKRDLNKLSIELSLDIFCKWEHGRGLGQWSTPFQTWKLARGILSHKSPVTLHLKYSVHSL